MELAEIVDILHKEKCSCVIHIHGKTTLCHERGVTDLLRILKSSPELLDGSIVADKVVGKGAAALMILGGVKKVYADVISKPALDLLTAVSVPASFGVCVPNIINRSGTGICPVETLCMDCTAAIDCLPLIEKFVKE